MGSTDASSAEEDRRLVRAVLAGDPGAFERLVRQYQRLCWHVISRMVRHPEDTRELCQETFLRVHRHLSQYRFESSLRSWIGQVAFSVAVRHVQRKGIRLVEPEVSDAATVSLDELPDDFDLEAASEQREIQTILHEEIKALAPLPRTILTLYHLDELSIGEIATMSGLPAGTIKSHLARSRAKLRARLVARLGGGS